jgi:hypothetical protein
MSSEKEKENLREKTRIAMRSNGPQKQVSDLSSDFRQKIPEILNWLTLVVRNCM